jgi:DNA-directed RNA polymerase subunit K/omega
VLKTPSSNSKKPAVEEPDNKKFTFTKTAKREIEHDKTLVDIPPAELKIQIEEQSEQLKSNEFHIVHQSIRRLHQLAIHCDSNLCFI